MTKATRRPSSRDKILDAAMTLVAEGGVQQLTMEATAAAAGVTKAGVVYHFKTRDDLLAAVVDNMARDIDVYSRAAEDSRTPLARRQSVENTSNLQRGLLDQVDMTLEMPTQLQHLMRSLLDARASHPSALRPVQALFERGYEVMATSGDPGRALLVSLAMDGMQLIDLLQLHQFSPAQRKAVKKAARELIAELN